jgi:hypothetical protein
LALTAAPAAAQNLITQDGWEGFAMRDADNRFDRCVLYNRTVAALTVSPYGMLGITRDATGRIGLLVFYDPRALTRGKTTVRIKLDQRPVSSVAGEALSDFHVDVPALEPDTVAALRNAKTIEVMTGGHTVRFELGNVGGVLERLDACVKIYGPKS